jgi:[amino group carrier protein]-lysine/ornithine hydrolase
MTEDIRLLFDLVNTSSVSGSERAAAEVFVEHASHLGFVTEIDHANNAIAHRGASEDSATVHIVLLGHIDTVPGEIPVRIEDGILHGRGSVDAKGPLAAMLMGAYRCQLPIGVRLSVIGAAGEETAGSLGARYLAPRIYPDACIIAEPSAWNGVTLGYKGRLLVTATTTRTNAHSAGPDPSAGDDLLLWWNRVVGFVEQFNREQTRAFDSIQATIQELDSASDGLHQSASLQTGFRLPPSASPELLLDKLTRLGEGFNINLETQGAEQAHATDRNDPVVRALSSAIRSLGGRPAPKLKTGTADLNVVAPIWNCPIAAYGPGDSSLDHTPIEHLHIDEYQRSIRVITAAIEMLSSELLESKLGSQSAAVP